MNKNLFLVFVSIIVVSVYIISCNKTTTNNTPPPPVTCDTVNIKYAANIVPILKANCYGCHGKDSTTGSGGILLEGYSNIQLYATDGRLAGTITHAAGYPGMPYLRAKLDSCSINKILAWINQFAPNN